MKFSPLNSTLLLFFIEVVPPKLYFLLGLQIPSAAHVARGNKMKNACVSTAIKNEIIQYPGRGDRQTVAQIINVVLAQQFQTKKKITSLNRDQKGH